MDEDSIWGPASVTYPDWNGTAQLDQRRTTAGIEEQVGLDPERWMVVGLDIGGGELSHALHVVAIDRALVPEGGDVLPKIASSNGGNLPVTEFRVSGVDPYDLLRAVTHQFELRMRLRGTRELPIQVVTRADVSASKRN